MNNWDPLASDTEDDIAPAVASPIADMDTDLAGGYLSRKGTVEPQRSPEPVNRDIHPLTPAQERRLRAYLEQTFLEINRNYKKR